MSLPIPSRAFSFIPAVGASPKRLDRTQVAHFNERGYVKGLPIFDPPGVTANRATFDRMLAHFHRTGRTSHSINGYHATCASIYDIAANPLILDYVEDILGPSFVCWGTHFFCKLPHQSKAVSWHQDAPYWPFAPAHTVTAWLAIDDVDEENAAMRVIPGSHLLGSLPMRESDAAENNVLWMTTVGADAYGEPVSMNMSAGEMSLHSDLLLHGSLGNHSHRRRCGLTIRYATTDVRASDQKPRVCVPGRGSDPSGYWVPLARPPGDDLEAKLSELVAT